MIRRLALVYLFSLFSAVLSAQIRSGTIVGSVTDPNGAPVPDCEVTVLDTGTNTDYPVRTNSSGEYAVPYLPAGTYSVSARKPGFKTSTQEGFALTTSQSARVDIHLEIGNVETSVSVNAAAVELQTETSQVTNRIDERIIRAIPNINNNPLNFATLQPGVVGRASMNDSQTPNSFGIGVEGRRSLSNISINGGTAFSNDIQLDGVSIQSASWGEAAIIPNTEGIAEVRTTINNMSAEYGRSQGTIIFATRSGTNEFHGSGEFRLRNEALNANTFSNNTQRIARPAFKEQRYSATVGGPVILPKLYDGRNKTFFFASYEGLRFNQGVVYQRTVPTAEQQAGDFSQSLASVGGGSFQPLQIFDPYAVTLQSNGQYARTPIPGNRIPASRLNPFAQRLLSNYPAPNRAPQDPTGLNNFLNTMVRQFSRDNVNTRFDHRLASHALYGTFGTNFGLIASPNGWGANSRGFTQQGGFLGATVQDRNYYSSIGDTWSLSPSLVADFRVGFTRINAQNLGPVYPDTDYQQLGIPASFNPAVGIQGMYPEVGGINYWSNLYNTAYLGKIENQTNWNIVGSVTKIRGRWTHKVGGEYRAYLNNYSDARGSFNILTSQFYTSGQTFAADGTNPSTVTANLAGHGGAAFLLGAGTIQAGENAVKLALLAKYGALYTQNDWRATNRLTLNLGFRWDWQPGPTDRYNRITSFSYNGTTFGSPGSLVFPGVTPGAGRSLYETPMHDFGPRVGLAYKMSDTLVFRAGFGINYLPSNTGYYGGPYYYGTQNFSYGTISQPYGTTPAGALVGQFNQVNTLVNPLGAQPNAPQYYGDGNNQPRLGYDSFKDGKVLQWNAFLEKQLGNGFLVSAGYAGTRSYRLQLARLSVNSYQFLPDSLLSQWRQRYIASNGNDPGTAQVANPFQPASGNLIPFAGAFGRRTVALRDTLNAYPLFPNNPIGAPLGYASYHALMLQVKRDFRNGLIFGANYTWSRANTLAISELENNNYGENQGFNNGNIDRRNLANSAVISANDIPHRFNLNASYELPFGPGKRFASGSGGWSRFAGGWQLASVVQFQSGQPLTVTGGSGAFNGLGNRVNGTPIEVPQELQKWYDSPNVADRTVRLPSGRQIVVCQYCYLKYNLDAYNSNVVQLANGRYANDIYWYGNAALRYGDIRSASRTNMNLALIKNFSFGERVTLTVTAEASNLLNSVQFRVDSITSGIGAVIVNPNLALGERPGMTQNANFGTQNLSTYDPRQVEFRARIRF